MLWLCFILSSRGGSLVTARTQVQMLVGRDTASLDEEEITRATVESVAENTVDGVTAPLLFALLGGAPGVFFLQSGQHP